jgi:thioredoxin 2
MPTTTSQIVTCPNCGARNRIDDRASTAQPVCGRCHAPLSVSASSAGPIIVTDVNFEQTLRDAGDRPMLIDCWAEWCPPCKMLSPTIDAIAKESAGRWVIGKLDVDHNRGVAGRFSISSIPTMLLFKNGQLIDQLVGLQPKQAIVARLSQ